MSADPISLAVSLFALFVSIFSIWLNHFHRAPVKMVRPPAIYFGPDEPGVQKVMLRTAFLYVTGKKPRVVESMYAELVRSDGTYLFDQWIIGLENYELGGGLFIDPSQGFSTWHHFIMRSQQSSFDFCAGPYVVNIYAHIVGEKKRSLLFSQHLTISEDHARAIAKNGEGVTFEWAPKEQKYSSSVNEPQPLPSPSSVGWLQSLPNWKRQTV